MFKACTRIATVALLTLVANAVSLAQQNLQLPATPALPKPPTASTKQAPNQTTQNEQLQRQGTQSKGQSVIANKPVMQGQGKDQMIASMLSLCNQKEAELGTITKQHTTDTRVKEFAEMMVRGHSEMVLSLQQFGAHQVNLSVDDSATASQSTGENHGNRDTANSNPQNRVTPNQSATAVTNNAPRTSAVGFDVFDIHREIAHKCLSEAKAEWAKKDPKESDMEYIGQQIIAHKEMIVSGKVLRNHASPELQKTIDRGIASAEGHLEEAHKLIKSLGAEKSNPSTNSKD